MIIIPSENFHAVRVSDPGNYKKIVTKDLGDGITLLLGVTDEKDESKTEPQSYHFSATDWKPKDVKKWLKEHDVKPIELEMATKQKEETEDVEQKENSSIVSRTGFVVEETDPIDKFPDKTFGNVRQDEIPELIDRSVKAEVENLEVISDEDESLESELENSELEEPIEVGESESLEEPEEVWNPSEGKKELVRWATSEDGSISKKPLMKWFLDVDAGDGQSIDNYRYPVGAMGETDPHYCPYAMDHSWNLAAGKETGVANRNIQKKIIFLKNREGFPLTDDQFDFTERHMSSEKIDYHTLEDDNSPGGVDFVPETELKLNSSPAGSKIIYEDSDVIDVPVIPMREGIFTGSDGIPTLKKFEYFGKDAHWLEGQPILKGHTKPTEMVTYKHNRIGKLMNVTARPDKKDVVAVARYYKEKLTPEDLGRIRSGNPYDGSIAYTTHTSFNEGEYDGQKYNAVEDGGYHFYHFAELANGIGACSSKQGCGFLLNEAPAKTVNTLDSFYNEVRRADIEFNGEGYSIKLNSKSGGNGIMATSDRNEAVEWAKMYVSKGLIPVEMKQNYNCPDSEKSGEGKGSCGGSAGRERDPAEKKGGGGGLRRSKTGSAYEDMHQKAKSSRKTIGESVKSGLITSANSDPGPNEIARAKEIGNKLEKAGLVPGSPGFDSYLKAKRKEWNDRKKSAMKTGTVDGEPAMLLKIPGKAVDKSDEMATIVDKGPGQMEVIPPKNSEPHRDAYKPMKNVGKFDKNRRVMAADSPSAQSFAKDYIKGEMGNHREGGPNAVDEKNSEVFWTKYDKVGGQSGFAGSGSDVFVNKETGEHFLIEKEPNGKTFYGTDYRIRGTNPEAEENVSEVMYKKSSAVSSDKMAYGKVSKEGSKDLKPKGPTMMKGGAEMELVQEGKNKFWRRTKRDSLKRNSRSSNNYNTIGNNMTEEYIQAESTFEGSEEIVQKMNEAFEQKLNERDARIKELESQVDDLVQKQNAAEEAIIAEKARIDFEAFTMKLNKAHQKDAQVHYDGFRADGWAYFDAHPDVFKAEIKMNAVGIGAAEGDSTSSLQNAREMLRKSQKERFSKRA